MACLHYKHNKAPVRICNVHCSPCAVNGRQKEFNLWPLISISVLQALTFEEIATETHHLLRAAELGPRWTVAPGWPEGCSSAIFIACVIAFITMSPRGIKYIQYLAQKDLSGGFTPSSSPFSPPSVLSANSGVLGACSPVFRTACELNDHLVGSFICRGYGHATGVP